jgi:alkylated DNA repair dioxygenase AlkB
MNNAQYHGDDCTKEVKLGSSPSVKSFFATKTSAQSKSDAIQLTKKIDFDACVETKGENEAHDKHHIATETSKCLDVKPESFATHVICTCPQSKVTCIIRDTKHLNLDIHHGLFASKNLQRTDPNNWYSNLLTKVRWHRVKYKSNRFQKDCETPCYTAFYGGRTEYKPYIPIPEWFAPLIDKVTTHLNENNKEAVPIRFNAFLLRLYFDGNDEIAWHTDGRTFLGDEPTIASLSLGNKASFQMRRMNNVWPCADGSTSTEGCIDTNTPIESFVLQDGDLLVMRGKTQQYWHHRVPKEKGRGVRLNINFRYVMPGVDAERGQMTYYKYMVYGDVPIDCEPPSWTYDEIVKKKGGIMNFVKGGAKRKVVEDLADPNPEMKQKEKDPKVAGASLNNSKPMASNLSETQQYLASDQCVDSAVFNELPIDIQNELVSQWKAQFSHADSSQSIQHTAKATIKKKPKQSSARKTLDSFFKKKQS